MTNLYLVYDVVNITAIEVYCGDDVKYCESFPNWKALLNTLSEHMDSYAYITVMNHNEWHYLSKSMFSHHYEEA